MEFSFLIYNTNSESLRYDELKKTQIEIPDLYSDNVIP